MVAQDFLLDSQVRAWLDGVEPAWSLLTFESFQELRQEPSATRTAIRIGNDLSLDEIAGSPIAAQHSDPDSGGDRTWRPAVDRNRQPDKGGGGRDVQAYRMAGLRSGNCVPIQQGYQRTGLPAVACRSPTCSGSDFCPCTAR